MKAWALCVRKKIVINGCLDKNDRRINQLCVYKTLQEAKDNEGFGWEIREVDIKIKPKRLK